MHSAAAHAEINASLAPSLPSSSLPLYRVKSGAVPYPACAGMLCDREGGMLGLVMVDVMGQPFVWYQEGEVEPCRLIFRDEVKVLRLRGYKDADLAPYIQAKAR